MNDTNDTLELILSELKKLSGQQVALHERMSTSEQRMSALEERMSGFDERMSFLESGQKELHQIVRSIRDRQETTDAKLDSLTMEVHKVHGEVTTIKDTMATKEDLEYFDKKVSQHEREIFKIKNRA